MHSKHPIYISLKFLVLWFSLGLLGNSALNSSNVQASLSGSHSSKNVIPNRNSTNRPLSSWDMLLREIRSLTSKQTQNRHSVKAFISYAWEDTKTPEGMISNSKLQRNLEALKNDLQSAGISVFLDITNMHGDIQASMQKHLNESDVVLPILTPRFKERVLNPNTNLAFEYKLILKKLRNNPNSVYPLHYDGEFSEAVPKELLNCLVRDFRNPANHQKSLVELHRPLGILPSIYNIDSSHTAYKKLIDEWKVRNLTYLPSQKSNFISRKSYLTKLKRDFWTSQQPLSNIQVLAGMTGVGKTALAIDYANENKSHYNFVRLINCGTTDLSLEFSQIALQLGIDINGMGITEIVEIIYKKLEPFRWLLIFDNVENYQAIDCFFPKSYNNTHHILVTTQNQNLAHSTKIRPFNNVEAHEYIKRSIHKISKQEATELSNSVGHLPLALNHATSYINSVGISVHSYLKLYNKKGIKILKHHEDKVIKDKENVNAFNTLSSPLDKIWALSPQAYEALLNFAYLNVDNIPIKLLTHELLLKSTKEVHKALLVLREYSLIESSQIPDHVNIHKLVQSAIKHEKRKNQEFILNKLRVLSEALHSMYGLKTSKSYEPKRIQLLSSHIDSLLDTLRTLEKFAGKCPQKTIIKNRLTKMKFLIQQNTNLQT